MSADPTFYKGGVVLWDDMDSEGGTSTGPSQSDFDALSAIVTSLQAQVATNTSNISANAANIATNTSNISTNAANIATNTSDISDLDSRVTTLEDA